MWHVLATSNSIEGVTTIPMGFFFKKKTHSVLLEIVIHLFQWSNTIPLGMAILRYGVQPNKKNNDYSIGITKDGTMRRPREAMAPFGFQIFF